MGGADGVQSDFCAGGDLNSQLIDWQSSMLTTSSPHSLGLKTFLMCNSWHLCWQLDINRKHPTEGFNCCWPCIMNSDFNYNCNYHLISHQQFPLKTQKISNDFFSVHSHSLLWVHNRYRMILFSSTFILSSEFTCRALLMKRSACHKAITMTLQHSSYFEAKRRKSTSIFVDLHGYRTVCDERAFGFLFRT